MKHSITVRMSKELADWLAETSRRTGITRAALVRDAIEVARDRTPPRGFLRHAGSIRGPKDLSQRKGFSRPFG